MSFEDTIRRIFGEVLEDKLRPITDRLNKLEVRVPEGGMLTVAQAAKFAGVEEDTIRAWAKDPKKLRVHRAGKRIRIKQAELERAMRPSMVVLVDDDIDREAANIVRKLGA
jgi:excisionase family DNA binding protein